ncbi:MAG: quinone-dependent dihydroorotate dehydrogenase [Archangiaceae bacterium]|nr:quinone-dependent dihydroorotate dehydrogenase [Archangiaceae bacterium]
MYEALLRPVLFTLDAEKAHHLGMAGLKAMPVAMAKSWRSNAKADRLTTTVAGLTFPNPIGLAAGLDKNAEALVGLFGLGFGFVEVGTVTPRPQSGNPLPRIFRIPEHTALINRLGFNNEGMAEMKARLEKLAWRPGPVGVNIGKNKDTPNERAVEDYVACAETVGPLGDYVVVNLSSPNTPGLRQLQEPEALAAILSAVKAKVGAKPLFLKIAPDLGDEAVDAVVDVVRSSGITGLICTNTTITRPFEHPTAKETGGLSGKPVFQRSTEVLKRAFKRSEGKLPIIGVGGVFDGDDAFAKIAAGASLVQIYTGFIYGGPGLPRRILDRLEQKLAELKLSSLSEAIGRDV